MYPINFDQTVICSECSPSFMKDWFYFRDKQVLNYIDTCYYTVHCLQDTSSGSSYLPFINFINSIKQYNNYTDDVPYLPICDGLYCETGVFVGHLKNKNYDLHLFAPDQFDIFICSNTPTSSTPFIQVQLRSTFLWLDGVRKSIDKSKKCLFNILELFDFDIDNLEVKENRFDYCFHTNYIKSPYKFFNPDNIANMQCSRFKSSQTHLFYYDSDKYDVDSYTFGQRNSPIFIRMYLKSKEVVECGYKNKKCFFISVWKQNYLISSYDAYVLTRAYTFSNWNYIDVARLEFYLEYGSDLYYIKQCKQLLDMDVKDYDAIRSLANKLTPPINLVINIEYQCNRKFFKSANLLNFSDDRLDNVFANTDLIVDYLTSHVFKFVKYDPVKHKSQSKYKCDYTNLWKLIRSRTFYDEIVDDVELTRSYSSATNLQMLKNRAYGSISSLSLVLDGNNSNDLMEDIEILASVTSDNDIADQKIKKEKRLSRISKLDATLQPVRKKYKMLNLDTGEL